MKRFLTMIVAISSILVAMAQNPMVTLSHNGELTFFTNLYAFEDALLAAENDDIIYLSEGVFISNNSGVDLNKRVSIIGSGYGSHILIPLNVKMTDNAYIDGQSLNFEGLRLKSLDLGYNVGAYWDIHRDNVGKVNINNCWIGELTNPGYGGNELLINRCRIDILNPYSSSRNNIMINNSKIESILQNNDDSNTCMTLKNCNVYGSYSLPTTVISSIIACSINASGEGSNDEKFGCDKPCTVINSLFNRKENLPTSTQIYNCYFDDTIFDSRFEDNLNVSTNYLMENKFLGQDGQVIGIYGGESPFSENPSLPTVDTSKSSVEYDAAGNKLKVSISVKAD